MRSRWVIAGLGALVLGLCACSEGSADARVCADQWETVFRQNASLGGLESAVERAPTQRVVMPPDLQSSCTFAPQVDEALRGGGLGSVLLVVDATTRDSGPFGGESETLTSCFDVAVTSENGEGETTRVDCPDGESDAS